MTIPVGTAAALDEAAAEHEREAAVAAETAYPRLLVLLKLARERLGPAGYDQLAEQIDEVLLGRETDRSEDGLVLESYGAGHAYFRAEGAAA